MPGIITIGVALTFLVYRFVPLPFVLILLGWFAVFVIMAIRGASTVARIIGINLAAILGTLGVAELVYVIKAEPWSQSATSSAADSMEWSIAKAREVIYEAERETYVRDHEYLGYAPLPDNRVRGRRVDNGKLVYDVVYTIDANGLRRSPDNHDGTVTDCILFFGGSYTVGEGVRDNEAMPYVVGERTRGAYRVYNFGFHGYGPHQMLSSLEHGIVDATIDCQPRHVFYQLIRAHVKRSAGLAPHDRSGPRYRLRESGELIYDGRFDASSTAPADAFVRRSAAYRLFEKSYLFKEIHRGTVIYMEQVRLLAAIVDVSRRHVEARWPGSQFHIILWNQRFGLKTRLLERALVQRMLRIHRVSDILPNYFADKERYRIHASDRHPNALAHEIIADYVVRQVSDVPVAASH